MAGEVRVEDISQDVVTSFLRVQFIGHSGEN
jgi:hypothetical protein